MKNNQYRLFIIFVMIFISAACSISFGNPEIVQPETNENLPAESASEQDGPSGEIVQDEPDISFNGISLSTGIGDSLSGSTIPGDPAGESFWSMPDHDEITVNGYPVDNDYHEPVIYVFPAAEYRSDNEAAGAVEDELAGLLAAKPADPTTPLPLLPIFNAGQLGAAKVKYIDFNNGSGIRYITQLGQAFWPFNNSGMIYTFQGMTSDGCHYVSILMPVSHPELAQYDNFKPQDDFYETAEQMIDDQIVLLENAPEDQFTPSLVELDAMAASISIQK